MCWVKLPGSPAQTTRPHQDCWYLRDVPRFWTVWLPLVETPWDVGPLAVVPGSHRRGVAPHVDNLTGIVLPPDTRLASNPVRPGDAVLFGEETIHCAWSNVSPTDVRVSFDIRYEPEGSGGATALHPAPFEGG
jgi:ectoine hydroxylase-related dioxygenase (phytanoyl-CoA dioxygenase family)